MKPAMTAEDILIELQVRNVRLNKPATIKQLRSLESKLQVTLHPCLSRLLHKFNGFLPCEYDWQSQICIWGTDEVISHSDMMIEVNGEKQFVIGDLLIYSDFITCSLENDSTPVFLLNEERRMASNIQEFFARLVGGTFDFM